MKKQYNSVKVEVCLFDVEDVVRTSGITSALEHDNTKAYSEWTTTAWED